MRECHSLPLGLKVFGRLMTFSRLEHRESPWSFSEISNRSFHNPLATVPWFKTIPEYVFRAQQWFERT